MFQKVATILFFPLLLLAAHPAVIKEEFVFSEPPFAACHASTLTETSAGHILCAWYAGTAEGEPDVKVWMSRLGQSWEAPHEVASGSEIPCWNPVLFTMPSKEILLFYKIGRNPKEWSGFLKRSLDGGKSWSAPELLPAGVIGPGRSKPLLHKDRLLCGSSIESYQRWGCWVDITTDGGKTWVKSNPINVKSQYFGIIEPTIFYSKQGTLRFLARAHQIGFICMSSSTDGGMTWSDAQPTSLPNPNAGIETVNLKDGRVLLVYNDSKIERTPLNLAVSKDGGATWKMTLILEDKEGEYSFPAMIQTSDGLVHITYTWNRKLIKHVVVDPEDL